MTDIVRMSLDDWEQVAAKAICELPPGAIEKLRKNGELKQEEVQLLAQFAWQHFQIRQLHEDGDIGRRVKEIDELCSAINVVEGRIKARMSSLGRCQRLAPNYFDHEVMLFNFARLALHKLKREDCQKRDGWKNLIPKGNTSHEPSLEDYLYSLMLTYSRLTLLAPGSLKLSSTKGPRTYLMNFLFVMTRPIPRFSELDDGKLAKRLHHHARKILNGHFVNLPKFPTNPFS